MEHDRPVNEVSPTAPISQPHTRTLSSSYLPFLLFVTLPLVGFYVGYNVAPERIVEVENVIVQEIEKTQDHISKQERRYSERYYIVDTISHSKSLLKSNGVEPDLLSDTEGVEVKIYLLNDQNVIAGALPIRYTDLVEYSQSSHMHWRPVDIWYFGGQDYGQSPPRSGMYRYLVVHQSTDIGCEDTSPEQGMCIPIDLFDGYTYDGTNTLTRMGPRGVHEVSIVKAYPSDFSFEIINHVPSDWYPGD